MLYRQHIVQSLFKARGPRETQRLRKVSYLAFKGQKKRVEGCSVACPDLIWEGFLTVL